MKKLGLVLIILAVFAVVFTGCAKATPHPGYNYRVTGNFAGWGSNFEAQYMMENIASNDERIKPMSSALRNAQYIYLWEYTIPSGSAGWTVDYPGRNISVDGNFAVKFIRLIADSYESSGWGFDMWIPSTEAGGITNLTPDVLYTPANRSPEDAEVAGDGLGNFNDNPVLLQGAGTYYIVFAVMKDNSRAMGAVKK